MTRTCAVPNCNKPLIRRKGEELSDFRRRVSCCKACGYRLRSSSIRSKAERLPSEHEMSGHEAAALLSRIPPRLLPRFEELPEAEKRRALAGWGVRT